MNQPSSIAAIYEHMNRAKAAGPVVTNFYPSQVKLQRWIEQGELFVLPVGSVLFVLRRDRDFLHLSYVASTTAQLAAATQELLDIVREVMTVDVIGQREQVDELADLFGPIGFHRHCALHRMTRLGDHVLSPSTADPDVALAGSDDARALARMLESTLDRFAEQIPNEDEMAKAAAERKVLIMRTGSAIAGLLFYEVTGQSSLLRHWLVDPAYRDQRIGARLMRRYIAGCADVRRFLLWVISDNENAILRYQHYGYHQDGLIDQVLIRQPS